MRIAKVIHIIVRKRGRSMVGGFLDVYQLLESLVTQKWSRGVRRGAIGKVSQDNSLVAYPTACTVPWRVSRGNTACLFDVRHEVAEMSCPARK